MEIKANSRRYIKTIYVDFLFAIETLKLKKIYTAKVFTHKGSGKVVLWVKSKSESEQW